MCNIFHAADQLSYGVLKAIDGRGRSTCALLYVTMTNMLHVFAHDTLIKYNYYYKTLQYTTIHYNLIYNTVYLTFSLYCFIAVKIIT